ncbi:MAG: ABC transporter ATP-binding protein [Alphaproteobacteria bacterium]|nr:ABC transporter ATP-binding protein [Alphaproteobacteria bacterium]
MTIAALCWPIDRLGHGLEELARRAGLRPRPGEALVAPDTLPAAGRDESGRWVEWAGARLGIEAEGVEFLVSDLEAQIGATCPAVLQVRHDSGLGYLLLLRARRGRVDVIGPDLRVHRCTRAQLRAAACAAFEAPLVVEIDRLLEAAALPPRRRARVREAMVRERLAAQRVAGCWILRQPATGDFRRQLAGAGLGRRLAVVVALFAVTYGLELSSWGLMGSAALDGMLDFGWLAAWFLLLISMLPLRLTARWFEATFALDLGRLLKKRLIAGALRMDLETVRHQGVGQLLARVMESQALESLSLNGGLAVVVAFVELAFAGWVLASGAGGALHLALMLAWLALVLALSRRYYRRLRAWTTMRLDLTNDLVEHMVGHRTRLAQELPRRRDEEEDRATKDYLNASRGLDHAMVPIAAAGAGGWMLAGLAGLVPAFVSGASPVGLAIGLGGILLANRAFAGISGGVAALARASIAWRQVSAMYGSARVEANNGPFLPAILAPADASRRAKLVDASEIVFRYRREGEAVLRGLDLSIRHGERILLQGPSGGGKSTLAALLVGLRAPESGLLLLNGLDRHTLGASWHRLAAEAPQFHENHLFAGTLGFNLLMGRNWPPSEEDLQEARALCEALGLGDLLARMPSGMQQQVGETGWQLSHGERSRVFLARALLQNAELTILDESFGALDPETLETCLSCAFDRARTLMVIAHP